MEEDEKSGNVSQIGAFYGVSGEETCCGKVKLWKAV